MGVISTMAATGSEMDEGGVITNWEQKLKLSGNGDACYPTFAILDPAYTYSVSKNQTAYGCVDILSHIFEIYFSKPDTPNVSDRLAEGLMRSVIENLDVVLKKPDDYTARANLMWCSTMALNGIIKCSKQQDWMSHQIEHALSAFYDIPHGAGLAIVHPVYMKYIYKNAPKKICPVCESHLGDQRRRKDGRRTGIGRNRENQTVLPGNRSARHPERGGNPGESDTGDCGKDEHLPNELFMDN